MSPEDGDGDGGKKTWVGRQWSNFKSWLSGDDKYTTIPKSKGTVTAFGPFETKPPVEEPKSWYSDGSIYSRINPSTIGVYNLESGEYSYALSFPQDFGSWGQEGSDGMIWIECMSCHAENGALRYVSYNSKEHLIGLVGSMLLQGGASRLITSTASISSVDDVMSNPNLLAGKTPAQVEGLLAKSPGWRVETLAKGSRKGQGWVLRHYNSNGNPTGPQIRWHPGGGHHGAEPYWRVVGKDGDLGGIIR